MFCRPPKKAQDNYGMVIGYEFRLKKYLYEVKQHKPEKYNLCRNYIQKMKTQKCPADMNQKEWDRKRITQAKVIAYVRQFLKVRRKKQPADIISDKKQRRYDRMDGIQRTSFKDIRIEDDIFFRSKVGEFLDNFTLKNNLTEETIRLTDMQKHDVELLLSKRHGYLQWEQGSGKSLAGIAMADYRFKTEDIMHTFVVGPAIAIQNTWNEILDLYGKDALLVKNLHDVNKIADHKYILLTFGMLIKYRTYIKKYLKRTGYRSMLLLDEADNISNLSAVRSKATLSCFQKMKFKALLSGTMTRNNISESFSQFYLLYGGTSNFAVHNRNMYVEEKKTKKIVSIMVPDENLYRPFPGYKKGYTLFQQSFNPTHASVFGVNKTDQDIYNSELLKELIDYSIITRKFDEIKGEKIYKIEQVLSDFNGPELELYSMIVKEFYLMKERYFGSTGDARKDSLLAIIQQLNLLLKACSVPHTFDEYTGSDKATKMYDVLNMVRDKQKVVIGCTRIKTVEEYARFIREHLPERKLFVITGATKSLKQRLKMVEEMSKLDDIVLVTTQQSLSSSMNIDFIDDIILPELDWNNSKMSQFYFRFIRFTSTRSKRVYFVTYKGSLESNLLQLIINKDRLNYFMKDEDLEIDDIYEKYGIDFDLMNMVLYKEKDEDGKMELVWTPAKLAS